MEWEKEITQLCIEITCDENSDDMTQDGQTLSLLND